MKKALYFLTVLLLATLPITAMSQTSTILINEVYPGSGLLFNDNFIELQNPTSKTLYLDGMVLARFGPKGGKLSGNALTGIVTAWKFPGKPGGKTLPISPGGFTVVAANAITLGGVNLSGADFETKGGILDLDNSAPNMIELGGSADDLKLTASGDAIILSTGEDTLISDGINLSTIIDGIQYTNASATGNLPITIDAGVAGGTAFNTGKAIERIELGITTHNSKNDFEVANPTPGFYHGAKVDPTLRASDLFPLTLNHYIDYDAYVTDTLGAIVPSTKTHASTTVIAINQEFEGKSGVVVVRDTSNATLLTSGTATDLHYVAAASGDIQAFADNAFLSLFAPDAFAGVLNAPNIFVDYLKTSAGLNVSYPVAHVNQDIDFQGQTLNMDIKATGIFRGKESISVNGNDFSEAYKFVITSSAQVTAGIIPVLSTSAEQMIWLVKGIGIVRSNSPTVTSGPIPVPGSERQIVGQGIRELNSVKHITQSSLTLSSSVANGSVWVQNATSVSEILLYDALGRIITSYAIQGKPNFELSIAHLSSGTYFIVGKTARGEFTSAGRLIVEH